ncbi:MAG: hypothetical protein KGJ41_02395 [Rhodospirillales bacterium]|nr:hypothetical protein [Rhodospirillales bacterium]MDE2197845.1 hypothetical protein [Rhodospirillales bacterium]MDE2576338.1 hypothetical protein [Rhodospirillales bacterium]
MSGGAVRRRWMLAGLAAAAMGEGRGRAEGRGNPFAQQQERRMDDRTTLAGLMEKVNPDVARMLRDPATRVRRMPTPFLRQGLIFLVEWLGPYKPVAFTVGFAWPGDFIVLLSDNRPGFAELVRRAGVMVETDEQRVAYALTELEATRRFDEGFAVLRGFDDLRPMAGPNAAQAARLGEIEANYRARIAPPRSEPAGAGWAVPVYALVRNDLCLFRVAIGRDGTSEVTKSVLEAGTPLLPRSR